MKTTIDIDKEYADKIETECFNGDWEFDHIMFIVKLENGILRFALKSHSIMN